MQNQRVEYRGYSILPITSYGPGSRWFGGYEISKEGKLIRSRVGIFPGFLYADAAQKDGIEHAKLEIDNLADTNGDSTVS